RTALWHDPIIEVEPLVVPNDLEVLAFVLDGVEDTPVPRRGDHDLPVREQLRRLRARLPPDDVILYRVELRERAVHTFRCAQHFVDVFSRDAIGDERPLQIDGRALP